MKKLILVLWMLVSWVNETALAEDYDKDKEIQIDEVTIVASSKENRQLRELPSAATLLSAEKLRLSQVQTIRNLTSIIPNLYIPNYGSRLTSAIYIRGIGSRINTPSVGLYVDNIPYIDKSAFDFNYSDVERIDVLRGPQGTLYGRNAMGGIIRVYTKSPFARLGTDVRMEAATRQNYRTSFTHSHRMNEHFALSLGGFYDYKGGFFRNKAHGNEKVDQGQSGGGRLRMMYLTDSNWKFDFNANYEYTDEGGYPYYYLGATNPEAQSEALKSYIGKIAYNRESSYRRNLLNTGLNIEHQAEHFIVNAVTGYQWLDDRMFLDQDFTPLDIYTIAQSQRIHTLSEEVVFKSKPDHRWQWTLGVFGFYQDLHTEAPVTFRAEGMGMLGKMISGNMPSKIEVPMGPAAAMRILPSLTVTDKQLPIQGSFDTPEMNVALFHQSSLKDLFGWEGFSATLGLRLDYEKMKLKYHSGTSLNYEVGIRGEMVRNNQVVKEIEMMPATALTVHSAYEGTLDKDYLQLLPKFALQYDLRQGQGNVYVSVAKGYRSGGYNIQMFSDLLQSSLRNDMMNLTKKEVVDRAPGNVAGMIGQFFPDGGENPDARKAVEYKPEETWSYEVGTHLNLCQNRLRMDASAFWMNTDNQQISRFAATGLGRETVNAGKSRSLGMELAMNAAITDELNVNLSYGYTYATFTDYVVSDKLNYNHHYVPFVPKHTLNAGGDYTFHLHPNRLIDDIVWGANFSGAGRVYWTEENSVSQSFYGSLNTRLSFRKNQNSLSLWVRNVLDKEYATFYFESMGNAFQQQAAPIQAGVELRFHF